MFASSVRTRIIISVPSCRAIEIAFGIAVEAGDVRGGQPWQRVPLVLLGVVVVGLVATFGMNFQVLVPPLADNVLHVGASGFGFLMAASGVGSTITALWVAFSRKVGPTPIVMGAIALGFGSILLAASSSFGIALVAMFIVGAGGIGMAVTANTTIQMAVPDQLRGRVMSVYTTVFAGSVPAGGLLMGAIASVWGVPLALMVGAVLSLAVGLGAWVWLAVEAAGRTGDGTPADCSAWTNR